MKQVTRRFALQLVAMIAGFAFAATASADLTEGKEYSRLKVAHLSLIHI